MDAGNPVERTAVCERMHKLSKTRFPFADDDRVDERVREHLSWQEAGVDAAPDNRQIGVDLLRELTRRERMDDLRTCHAGDAEARGTFGERAPKRVSQSGSAN